MMTNFVRRLLAALPGLLGALVFFTGGSAFSQNPSQNSPKRVYIVQSYEPGHVCGEPQAEGELQSLAAAGWTVGRNLEVKTYYMDTYRTNTSPETMHREGQKALQEINEFKPDIVFTNDDAAVAEVMLPLIGGQIPVVFSGMNGQPEMYDARKHYMESWAHPGSNVTGVYEKLYVAQSLKVMEEAIPSLRGAKAIAITDYTPTGNGLTKQFELELKDVTDVHWEVQRVQNWS